MTRFALFYQSVISDWNHGNAHFLRGLMRALQARQQATVCYEQVDNWSLTNLLAINPHAIEDFVAEFPDLHFERYSLDNLPDLREADVVIVHEWNDPGVIRRIGELSRHVGVPAYFHDTHYRVLLDAPHRESLGLSNYQAILAYSPSVADRYRALGFERVHVLHEAADTTVFSPQPVPKTTDVVFVGNYGDGDRSDELEEYIFGPRMTLPRLNYTVFGVRYPDAVVARLNNGLNINYGGWLSNIRVPRVYSSAKIVLHVPRRQYVELLPGTPTIRVFEALATGACLISLPWEDTDHLFRADDFAVAHSPKEMRELIDWLCTDDAARQAYGARGLQTILERHTCGHRADELLEILQK